MRGSGSENVEEGGASEINENSLNIILSEINKVRMQLDQYVNLLIILTIRQNLLILIKK
jgi:hypothetical protein